MAERQNDDYGYSGRTRDEGNYSDAYGRGTAGETDTPSAGGSVGAGYSRGGGDVPAPDDEDGPVREGDEDDPSRA